MAREDHLWLSFRGVTSTTAGAQVLRLTEPDAAAPKGALVDIPGRDGALWLPDGGSESVEVEALLKLDPDSGRAAAATWLCGSGDLVLSGSPLYRWKAFVAEGVRFVRDSLGPGSLTAEVRFVCGPFRYLAEETALTFTEGAVFDGAGEVPSRPEITVYGSGDINLMVNDCTVLLEDVDEQITLDCEAMMAFRDGVNASGQVTLLSDDYDDDWPSLKPAGQSNGVSWTVDGGAAVTRVVVQPNWRFR